MPNSMNVVRRIGLMLSLLFILVSTSVIVIDGVKLGQDFTGGYVSEFTVMQPISHNELKERLNDYIHSPYSLHERAHNQWQVYQTPENGQADVDWFEQWLAQTNAVKLDSSFLGAAAGEELIEQGSMALLFATLAVMFYLAVRFEWRLSLAATLALVHDVLLTLAVLSFFDIEFTLTVLAAILAIIGYSLNDSIVIGDKIRELIQAKPKRKVAQLINEALAASMSRTLITSLTTLGTIVSIWWLAGAPLRGFAITLFTGVLVGTWSSIFISATLPQFLGLSSQNYTRDDSEEVKRQLAEP
ncbi:protein translocase subunit SecF [Pseudoalteromonas pernae]|uniref:protein translocase subunit SecF n=1 Tax=Pseudoalteromonas pernae TaxID=3118054 RepID=UPI003242B036